MNLYIFKNDLRKKLETITPAEFNKVKQSEGEAVSSEMTFNGILDSELQPCLYPFTAAKSNSCKGTNQKVYFGIKSGWTKPSVPTSKFS